MFLGRRFFYICVILVVLYSCGAAWPFFFVLTKICGGVAVVALLVDFVILFFSSYGKMVIERMLPKRMSCGDENKVTLTIESPYGIKMNAFVLDELPDEMQKRDLKIELTLDPDENNEVTYSLIPKKRGLLTFHHTNVFVYSPFHILERRFVRKKEEQVKVYPAFLFMHEAQLLSPCNQNRMLGTRAVKRKGSSTSFDTIREYTTGDDYRTINWHATARRSQLMVNTFTDEVSQNIISVIDKGRGMQHSFDGITLLDYSINAALRLSYNVLKNKDYAGFITFSKDIDSYISPSNNSISDVMSKIMESLYDEKTSFAESDYSKLMLYCQAHVKRRSLMVVYTSFVSMSAMRRQLPFLRNIAKSHAVLVVFFEDQDMKSLAAEPHLTDNDYIVNVLARSSMLEKKQIVSELHRNGIAALLTSPKSLTADVINKYMEIKSRGII